MRGQLPRHLFKRAATVAAAPSRSCKPPSWSNQSLPQRRYSTHPPNAKLNLPIDYATTPLLAHTSQSALNNPELPPEIREGTTKKMNLFQSINDALSIALAEDESVLLFGEDVAFGGVFRCSMKLAETYGGDRVFNTPLSEQGIMGFAIGCAAEGMRPIAEIQFADYVFPAFDQMAKGLLLAAIRSNDPCIFMEPKVLYRAAVEQVPVAPYELPLSKAEVLKEGKDLTIISYGQPLYICQNAIKQAEQDLGISIELVDLRTVYPWDKETVFKSVQKTGRCMVVHEAMVNAGVGAEVAAAIQEDPSTFIRLEAPVARVAGWSTPTPLVFERFNLPDVANIKALTVSEPSLVKELGPAFQKYNEEQFTTAKLPGSSDPVIVSSHNSLGDGRYYDVESSTSFEFDHATQKASGAQSHSLESAHSDLVKSTLKSLGTYVKEHFPNASYGVYPIENDSKLAIITVASKYSPNNFWNGRWRSLYLFDPSDSSLEGSIKVDVHYYEDGNVRLLANKAVTASVSSGTGSGIAKEISTAEKKYQEELNKGFTSLSEGAFKSLRRQLPVTRQKIEWDKVASYRLGQDIGGGSSRR
ncbi:hypothetical protein INS49_009773 [Diaporthe citri]|uniref:uncharacterized protein n=1 Tax=Diaporthe citri TaxID=83186 RepID=UPI001C817B21|nr:uncharacterized protein INS49_009773 [Diaporthe citri]KAG6361546.1 hypothetical protein INS49_009773 [Diaporthe citri]